MSQTTVSAVGFSAYLRKQKISTTWNQQHPYTIFQWLLDEHVHFVIVTIDLINFSSLQWSKMFCKTFCFVSWHRTFNIIISFNTTSFGLVNNIQLPSQPLQKYFPSHSCVQPEIEGKCRIKHISFFHAAKFYSRVLEGA